MAAVQRMHYSTFQHLLYEKPCFRDDESEPEVHVKYVLRFLVKESEKITRNVTRFAEIKVEIDILTAIWHDLLFERKKLII